MKKHFRKIVAGLSALTLGLVLTACSSTNNETANQNKEEKVLKISAIPDFNQADLTRSFDSFAAYLSQQTGMKVEYVHMSDYAAVVSAFERGDIDLAWFGGLTGVQARALVEGSEAIAQRPQDEKFQSVFIKQKSLTDVTSLETAKGHSLAFGSESSTSGHLMPRFFITQAGLNPETDFNGTPVYSGSHDKTYGLVEAGSVEIGSVNKQYWDKAVKENKVDLNKIEVFYTTPEYYDYNWTISNIDAKFGAGTKEKIKSAILAADANSSEVMKLLSAEKFIAAKNDNYKSIEEVAKSLKLIK